MRLQLCVLGLPVLAGLGRCAMHLCNATRLPHTGLAWRGLAAVQQLKLFGQGGLCYSLCVLGHDTNGMGSKVGPKVGASESWGLRVGPRPNVAARESGPETEQPGSTISKLRDGKTDSCCAIATGTTNIQGSVQSYRSCISKHGNPAKRKYTGSKPTTRRSNHQISDITASLPQ